MPVYGKGRVKRLAGKPLTGSKNWVRTKITRNPYQKTRSRRRYEKGFKWPYSNTSLRQVEAMISFPIQREVAKLVAKSPSGKKPVVVDWGCGTGRAVMELAKPFAKSAEFYGFADLAHKGWMKSNNVKFIHGVESDFARYFKNNSIDLMYSHFGLSHIPELESKYIKTLLPKLKVGGKLVMNIKGLDFSKLPKNKIRSASALHEKFQLKKGGKKLNRFTTSLVTTISGMNFKITYPEEERMVADKIIFERLK